MHFFINSNNCSAGTFESESAPLQFCSLCLPCAGRYFLLTKPKWIVCDTRAEALEGDLGNLDSAVGQWWFYPLCDKRLLHFLVILPLCQLSSGHKAIWVRVALATTSSLTADGSITVIPRKITISEHSSPAVISHSTCPYQDLEAPALKDLNCGVLCSSLWRREHFAWALASSAGWWGRDAAGLAGSSDGVQERWWPPHAGVKGTRKQV